MSQSIIIESVNYDGEIANVIFKPDVENIVINLGDHVLPFTFNPSLLTPPRDVYGTYTILVLGYDCPNFLNVPRPTSTPTPTPTSSKTPTPTPTPTITPTPSYDPCKVPTPTPTNTPTTSVTPTVTPTPTETCTNPCGCPKPSKTPRPSKTPTPTPTHNPCNVTPTPTPTMSSTPLPAVLVAIIVTPQNPSIIVGGTLQLIATGYYSDGTHQNITNICNWGSGNSGIVSVNNTTNKGLITGVSGGTTPITATYGLILGSTDVTSSLTPENDLTYIIIPNNDLTYGITPVISPTPTPTPTPTTYPSNDLIDLIIPNNDLTYNTTPVLSPTPTPTPTSTVHPINDLNNVLIPNNDLNYNLTPPISPSVTPTMTQTPLAGGFTYTIVPNNDLTYNTTPVLSPTPTPTPTPSTPPIGGFLFNVIPNNDIKPEFLTPTPTPTSTPTDSKIIFYDFSNPETISGLTINNPINGCDGRLEPDTTTGSSPCNTYLILNGVNNYFITSDVNPYLIPQNTSTVISIFMWVYLLGDGVIMSEQGSDPPNSSWYDSQIELVGGTLKFSVWPETAVITSSIETPLNHWYYIGFTYDGEIQKAYVNGMLAGSSNVNRQTPFNYGDGLPLLYDIGGECATSLGDGGYGNFYIGTFEVFANALTEGSVVNNYNSTSSKWFCITPTPTPTITPTPTLTIPT